jgi:hypothetical protein
VPAFSFYKSRSHRTRLARNRPRFSSVTLAPRVTRPASRLPRPRHNSLVLAEALALYPGLSQLRRSTYGVHVLFFSILVSVASALFHFIFTSSIESSACVLAFVSIFSTPRSSYCAFILYAFLYLHRLLPAPLKTLQ